MRKNKSILIGVCLAVFAVLVGMLYLDYFYRQAFKMLADGMKKAGWHEVPPIQKQIQEAIDSKDSGEIIRAFHGAIYDQFSEMHEAIPALKIFLSNPDPWIKFLAAQDLYIAGDNSGMSALVDLMQEAHPVRDYDGSDLRVHAAEVLEKYKEKRAIDALEKFCLSINNYSYIDDTFPVLYNLAKLAKNDLPPELIAKIEKSGDPNLNLYTLSFIDPKQAEIMARVAFDNPKTSPILRQQLKITAAFVMLRIGEKEPYYSYLLELAKIAIVGEPPSGLPVQDPYIYSLQILASIKNPENKALLENALSNKNIRIVEIALVNLIFNQGGSNKARQYLLNKLLGPTNELVDSDFLMQLAATINDPEINQAAASVDSRSGSNRWNYFEDRKNWSIYNWIDDYVLDLNESK